MAGPLILSRTAAVALATVGLFLCPFRCAEAAQARSADAAVCSSACGCGHCHGGESAPVPADDCRGECVCKALPDAGAKVSPENLGLLSAPIGDVAPSALAAPPRPVGRDASLTRPDVDSGSALRVAISSLLL